MKAAITTTGAIRFIMIGYSSIIGPFDVLDVETLDHAGWVRSTNCGFDVSGNEWPKPAPPVDPLNRPFEAAHRGPFQAVEGVQDSGFVGQALKCERLEHDLGFRGMDEALAGDLLRHDAVFEEDDAHTFLV